MSETEHSMPLERRPACDNCKTRKTKCDRRSPCASCVTLNVACRTTRQAGEKRQRVLLSSKYEDAVQDVSRQLADVREMLKALTSNKDTGLSASHSQETSLDAAAYTPQSMIDEQVPTLESVQEGYHGDSSFTSHAHKIQTTLEATLPPSELEFPLSTSLESDKYQNQDEDTAAALDTLIQSNDIGLRNMPLPPNEMVLKLLRLVRTEKQRFFVDLPLFDSDEFIAMCRDTYFATEPVSLWTWISVNVGLYNLFLGVNEANRRRLGTTVDALQAHSKVLKSNAEAALRSLRLCSEPSTESCRALAVLANFYVREGHSTIAWRLISGAARAALDLGLHRLPSDASLNNVPKEVGLFWHIYAWEKGLAMTCGKSPTIRHSDVTSGLHLLAMPEDRTDVPMMLYGAFIDMAVVMGEIQECLFSVVAQQSSQQTRIQHVKRLASRLMDILNAVKSVSPNDPSWDGLVSNMFGGIITTLDIVLHCQLAIVYRFLPPEALHSHPLQCSIECVNEARVALSMLVKVGEVAVLVHPVGWSTLLNIILCLVPLVPFIVLAGNAIATSSSNDLPLLSKMVLLLQPAAANSPLIQKVHGACESLGKIADRVVSSASPPNLSDHQEYNGPLDCTGSEQFDYSFPMGQQDWDSVMTGFEAEFGDYDSRTLANIIEPCFANAYW
ncbi:hypothetical protein HD806DRAFT_504383 [Xylariaceae sp. AK1471]|nr:hypothetical protein HD806DRAFT_504383 [Xylariaceae sp. AK1471]